MKQKIFRRALILFVGMTLCGSLSHAQVTSNFDVTENGCTTMSDEFVYLITASEDAGTGISIYPNPFTSTLSIELPTTQDVTVQIIDALGRSVRQQRTSSTASLQLEELSAGCYALIISASGRKSYHRIIKKD